MSVSGKVLSIVAFVSMALFGLFGALFVAGETFDDPGGGAAVVLTASWLIPLTGLSVFALLRPGPAGAVLTAVTAMTAGFTLADSAVGLIPRDDRGPVAAIAVFALGVALAFLGLHRATLAGVLMIIAGLAQLAATVMVTATRATGDEARPGVVLGGSSGVVIVPLLVVGFLFVLAGSFGREPSEHTPVHHS
ncbi:hypothetical protein ACIBL3_21800 [Kribbella sp. NPDC050124]|uniref:hypothetical protein n=1 Tax=Kribbella sp. NPDC050124 TaxID=3364114 RepID=UPI00379A1E8B